MGKLSSPNFNKQNQKLRQRIEQYIALIAKAYDSMAKDAANLAGLTDHDGSSQFSFSDYPLTKNAIKTLQQKLAEDVTGIIMSSTSEEWRQSNLVQDLLAQKILKRYYGTTKMGEGYERYFQTNPDSLKAFQERRDLGMNLSSDVWNLSEQFKSELEESITVAIADGTSAMSLAARVKQYLKDPDKRFRRRKETMEDGSVKWHLSNPAKAYHPGAGRYRSSARNAQRLARTEINMAYRTAEQKRWEQFDFVVGYEVKTTYSEKHVTDICDTLAGKYPKDFKFTGWHPNCMCYCIPILKTEEEFWADDSENSTESVNEVKDVPEGFKDWIRDNRDRIESAERRRKLPYFIADNNEYIQDILKAAEYKKKDIKSQSKHLTMEIIKSPGGEYLKPLTTDEKLYSIIELTGVTKDKAQQYLDAVESFSHGWDYEIREYQRTGSVTNLKNSHTFNEVREKSKMLEEFLSKSPQWISPTYRGMGLTEDEYEEMIKKLKAGSFDMRGTASWSSEIKDANRYAYDSRWDKPRLVVFECESNGMATSIRHLSIHPDENEVLVSNSVRYRMVGEPIEDKLYGRTKVLRIKVEAISEKET